MLVSTCGVFAFFTAVLLRRGELRSTNRLESMLSREASFLLNNWVFMALLAVVLLGNHAPGVLGVVWARRGPRSGPPFFNAMAGPLASSCCCSSPASAR